MIAYKQERIVYRGYVIDVFATPDKACWDAWYGRSRTGAGSKPTAIYGTRGQAIDAAKRHVRQTLEQS